MLRAKKTKCCLEVSAKADQPLNQKSQYRNAVIEQGPQELDTNTMEIGPARQSQIVVLLYARMKEAVSVKTLPQASLKKKLLLNNTETQGT